MNRFFDLKVKPMNLHETLSKTPTLFSFIQNIISNNKGIIQNVDSDDKQKWSKKLLLWNKMNV